MKENIRNIEDTINIIKNHNGFFDMHTHILPAIDDGSKAPQESVLMLKALKSQGAYAVAATPHFRAEQATPREFIKKREIAKQALKPHLTSDMPRITLGAEVHYFQGISRCEDLDLLTIDGTNLLLLEMPFVQWSDRMVKEILNIVDEQNIIPIIAHIDRYIGMQSKKHMFMILNSELLIQANAAAFYTRGLFKKMKKLLICGKINFIGSDCHNMAERCPDLDKAAEKLLKGFKKTVVEEFLKGADKLLEKARFIEV